MHHCVSCDVGLHNTCYESYEIKPLHKVEPDMYVCIPCMTLATQINQEEVEEVAEVLGTKGNTRQFKCITIIINYI